MKSGLGHANHLELAQGSVPLGGVVLARALGVEARRRMGCLSQGGGVTMWHRGFCETVLFGKCL